MLEEFLKDSEFASMMHRNIYDLLYLRLFVMLKFYFILKNHYINDIMFLIFVIYGGKKQYGKEFNV